MLKMKKMLMFLLLLGGGLSGYSREHLDTASLAIYYRQGRSSFDAVYRNNGTRLDAFMERFRRLQGDTLCSLRYVHVVGGSSPEGGRAVNERLARLRARQMERRLESDIPLADSLVEYSSSGVDWEGLTSLVETSGLFCREQALDVLRNAPERTVLGGKPVDSRKRQLMTLYGGRAWTAMSAELFPSLRSARIRAVYDRTRLCDLPMWKRSETSFRRASETVNEMRGGVMGLDSLVGRTEVPDSVRAVMTQVVEVLRNSVEAVSSRDRLDGLLARLRAVERPDSVAALSREAAEVISEAEEVLSTARKRLATATDGRQQAEQITSVDSLGDSPQTRTRFAALCGTVFDSSREVCEAASVWERHEAELTDLAERTERLFRQPDPVESAESAKKPFYMSLKTNLLYDLALVPNLGVVIAGDSRYTIADVPGLIPGASEGKGLGLEFLRHIERTEIIAHVIDCATLEPDRDPMSDYHALENELALYADKLELPLGAIPIPERPRIVILNKIDVPEAKELAEFVRPEFEKLGLKVFEISTASHEGLKELNFALSALVHEMREEVANREQAEEEARVVIKPLETKGRRPRRADEGGSALEFTVERRELGNGEVFFEVRGVKPERWVMQTNFDNDEAVGYLADRLAKLGVEDELRRKIDAIVADLEA